MESAVGLVAILVVWAVIAAGACLTLFAALFILTWGIKLLGMLVG